MFYEERMIDGEWHFRTTPGGEWRKGRWEIPASESMTPKPTMSLRERIEREADAHDYFAANSDLRMTTGDHAARAEKLRAIAAALSTPPAGEWMPIASAPKDGTHVWLGAPGNMRVGFWHYPAEGWIDFSLAESGSQRTVHFTPTHWQPLPPPPEPATQEVR